MYDKLKDAILESKNIVVFTGAGISCPAPTNIPDFRSENGLYQQKVSGLSAEEIISHSYFMKHPKEFFDFYGNNMVFRNAKYNKAHSFFKKLEKIKNVSIVTQNIDGLHTLAGSSDVYELHGNVFRNYCMRCHKFYSLDVIDVKHVPYCECGGIIKPDVVLYEEPLNEEVVEGAIKKIMNADLLIVVGTSLTVYPAASFLRYFKGNTLCLINKSKTEYDNIANIVYNDDIIKVIEGIEGDLNLC